MQEKRAPQENVRGINRLRTVVNNERAGDLFLRILRAVEAETEEARLKEASANDGSKGPDDASR